MQRLQFVHSLLVVLLLATSLHGQAQEQVEKEPAKQTKKKRPTAYWPESIEHSAEITTPIEQLGFRIGQRHLDHAKLVAYLTKLASESERFQIEQYGKTHGGRPLMLLTISSPKNLERLADIKKRHKRLADPKRSANVSFDDLPAVINMGYGVHGDEASATNCSALVAHYLAAAEGDEIEEWLDNCVILLDPSLNPDGFNRFANWVNDHRGRVPNPDAQHREHNQPWPSGRVNYYWFDLNRDWLPLEQPESRSRMRWYHAWKPNVVLDFHEMGTDSTYFFQPGVPKRTNPLTPAKNIELTARFGDYHASALDKRGSLFYTKERFDDFYMGKGSTYPDLHGAVGILFEQASARGHVQNNQDGQLRFHDAIANHFTTSLSSLKATSDLREELLEHKKSFYEEAITMAGDKPYSAITFSCPSNWERLERFAQTLRRHDIRCYRPKQATEIGGEKVSRDTLVVPLEQPEYRFLQSLLMRRKNFRENIFYDVSCWTLPLAYGLKQSFLKGNVDFDALERLKKGDKTAASFEADDNAVAYAVDWRADYSVSLLNDLLKREVIVRVATRRFATTLADESEQTFEQGTLMIPLGVQKNRRKQIERLLAKAAKHHVGVFSITSGLSIQGADLGSNDFKTISKPKVLMASGRDVSQYGAGELWHLLDVNYRIPLTMSDRPGRVDLLPYNNLVFPPGRYSQTSAQDWNKLAAHVRNGATAIAIGNSCGLVGSKLTNQQAMQMAVGPGPQVASKTQLPFDSAAQTRALQLISGAIFQTQIDLTHPLFYGYTQDKLAVFRNHAQFLQPSRNPYGNPGIYDPEQPHLAGYCSEENLAKIKTAASVVVTPIGRGRLIQISDPPNFRAFWHGTSRVFMNALFFGEFSDPPSAGEE